MKPFDQDETFRRISQSYAVLGDKRQRGLPFVSDWNGAHSYVEAFLGDLAARPLSELGDLAMYSFPQEDPDLHRAIGAFHRRTDGVRLAPRVLLVGGGATSMLAVLVQLLRDRGTRTVHYFAPLHYTINALFSREDIQLVRVAERMAFEHDFDLELPERRNQVLILSDPIWHVGRPVPTEVLHTIRDWQQRTGSVVIVDGTFQYLGWSYDAEASCELDPDLTLRLICPTKTLLMNGFRFSYLILPRSLYELCASARDLYVGTTSLSDQLFARTAMQVMRGPAHCAMLREVEKVFDDYAQCSRIEELITPTCGYFAFVKPAFDPVELAAMGPEHFDIRGYEGWIRINLMSPDAQRVFLDA